MSELPRGVALVIGMSDYRTVAKLDNTVNDATDISNMLQGIGFEVTTVLDAGFDELRATIDQFAFNAETADLALIYDPGRCRCKFQPGHSAPVGVAFGSAGGGRQGPKNADRHSGFLPQQSIRRRF